MDRAESMLGTTFRRFMFSPENSDIQVASRGAVSGAGKITLCVLGGGFLPILQ
jgi:hypothetical protein